jgi:hypothetical protein
MLLIYNLSKIKHASLIWCRPPNIIRIKAWTTPLLATATFGPTQSSRKASCGSLAHLFCVSLLFLPNVSMLSFAFWMPFAHFCSPAPALLFTHECFHCIWCKRDFALQHARQLALFFGCDITACSTCSTWSRFSICTPKSNSPFQTKHEFVQHIPVLIQHSVTVSLWHTPAENRALHIPPGSNFHSACSFFVYSVLLVSAFNAWSFAYSNMQLAIFFLKFFVDLAALPMSVSVEEPIVSCAKGQRIFYTCQKQVRMTVCCLWQPPFCSWTHGRQPLGTNRSIFNFPVSLNDFGWPCVTILHPTFGYTVIWRPPTRSAPFRIALIEIGARACY